MGTTYIFLDDIRNPPDDSNPWIVVRDIVTAFDKFIIAYNNNDDIVLSLDHDLGNNTPTGNDLVNIVEKLIANKTLRDPKIEFRIHSANPVRRANMEQGIKSIYRFLKEI